MLIIFFTVSERQIKKTGVCKIFKLLPQFITNPAIRNFCMFVMIKYLGLNLFDSISDFTLIEKGFSYDHVIMIDTFTTPMNLIVPIIGSKWLIRGRNQQNSVLCIFVFGIKCIMLYFLVHRYKGPEDDTYVTISMIISKSL